jgi:Glycosyl transferase family 2
MSSIDIVVPCYCYGHYLRDCVHSVLTQGGAELHVLILDDASPDETPDVGATLAAEDPRVNYRRHVVNRGHIATFNEGLDWASADYMLLLSADDYLLPGALKRAIDLMDAHPEVGLCFGQAQALDTGGLSQPMKIDVDAGGASSVVISGADFVRLFVRSGSDNIVPTPTAVVRTGLLKLLGGYRDDLPHTSDMEMWLRLAAHASVGIVKTDQAVYRRHAENMSCAYLQDECLSDLEQRKTACDAFLHTCRDVMPEAEHLHRCLLWVLSVNAVGHASSAFNSNRMELSRRLCDFAVSVHPGVSHSLAWRALSCKKLLGLKVSSALLPAIARIRAATTRIRN